MKNRALIKKIFSNITTIAVLACVHSSVTAETIQWKMHTVWPDTRHETKSAKEWAARVNERAKDQLHIQVYSGGSLGIKDVDMVRQLPPGNIIQATSLSAGYIARDAPELAYILPEGVLARPEALSKIMPRLDKMFAEAYAKRGIKYLATFIAPDRSLDIYCKTPVNSLDELSKKKLRVWSKPLVDSFSKLGVSSTVIPQGDLYMALQTGVVDCSTYYPGAANTISLHEVAPYWAFLADYAVPIELVLSMKAWEKLPPELQKIMQEEADAVAKLAAQNFMTGTYEDEQANIFNSKGGKQLEPFPEVDRTKFRTIARENWKKMAEDLGGSMQEYYNELADAVQ